MPNAIAEGLKVNRLIETDPKIFNAYPLTDNGFILPNDKEIAKNTINILLNEEKREEILEYLIDYKSKMIDAYLLKKEATEEKLKNLEGSLLKLKGYIDRSKTTNKRRNHKTITKQKS